MTQHNTHTLPPRARWLIGRISEHRELAMRLAQRPGLLVLEVDPQSGTSGVLAHALEEIDGTAVIAVDARNAADALDLAMLIAGATVRQLAPEAVPWWNDPTIRLDTAGMQLMRAVSQRNIDLENLQNGAGSGPQELRHAIELAAELANGNALLAIDHLDTLLERLSPDGSRQLLGALRAERQRPGTPEMVLVGRTDGRLAAALRDKAHPLYRAGQVLGMRRPDPQRFVDDLAIARPWTSAQVDLVRGAAELAAGSPPCVWRIIDLATESYNDDWVAAWEGLYELAAPQLAGQMEQLASINRAAPTVLSTLASDIRPYEAPLADKSVRDALQGMRGRGVVYAPSPRRWAISDPLLATWARDHAPAWLRRRRAARRRKLA